MNEPTLRIDSAAQILSVLAEAAELEHGVMCCYLYAAFSLKTEPSDGLRPAQVEAAARWKDTLMTLAIEEMGHLALVSNLLVSLGASAHFGRQNFPVPPGYHPADIRLGLAAFDRDVLDHFIFLERSADSDVRDPARFSGGAQYDRGGAFGRFFPTSQDYATIGEMYREIERALTDVSGRLGEAVLFSGGLARQVGPETVQLPGLMTVAGLEDALQALSRIVQQGEGGSAHDEDSHFARLLGIRREYDEILSADSSFVPSRPVAANPVMRRPPVAAGLAHIDHPQSAAILDAANAAYTVMLCCLTQAYVRSRSADPAEKRAMLDAAIGIMGVVGALGTALTRLPSSDTSAGVHAGLNFEAPRALRPLLAGPSERMILSLALRRVAEAVGQLPGVANAAALASRLVACSTTLESVDAMGSSGQST